MLQKIGLISVRKKQRSRGDSKLVDEFWNVVEKRIVPRSWLPMEDLEKRKVGQAAPKNTDGDGFN